MKIHRLRRGLSCRVLLRDGYPGRNSSRRLHRLHGVRGGLPRARHLCGRRRSFGVHKRHRVQRCGGSTDQGFRRAGNHSPQRCATHRERTEESLGILRRIRKPETQEKTISHRLHGFLQSFYGSEQRYTNSSAKTGRGNEVAGMRPISIGRPKRRVSGSERVKHPQHIRIPDFFLFSCFPDSLSS